MNVYYGSGTKHRERREQPPASSRPAQLAQPLPAAVQQSGLPGSRSNVARHDLGCVGIASGVLFAGPFTVSRLPSSCHQAVTHASPDPLVESPRLGPWEGTTHRCTFRALHFRLHLTLHRGIIVRNVTQPTHQLCPASGNRQQPRQATHTKPQQPSGCVRVKATRPGDRVPCAAPHAVPVRSRYYYYC